VVEIVNRAQVENGSGIKAVRPSAHVLTTPVTRKRESLQHGCVADYRGLPVEMQQMRQLSEELWTRGGRTFDRSVWSGLDPGCV